LEKRQELDFDEDAEENKPVIA